MKVSERRERIKIFIYFQPNNNIFTWSCRFFSSTIIKKSQMLKKDYIIAINYNKFKKCNLF